MFRIVLVVEDCFPETPKSLKPFESWDTLPRNWCRITMIFFQAYDPRKVAAVMATISWWLLFSIVRCSWGGASCYHLHRCALRNCFGFFGHREGVVQCGQDQHLPAGLGAVGGWLQFAMWKKRKNPSSPSIFKLGSWPRYSVAHLEPFCIARSIWWVSGCLALGSIAVHASGVRIKAGDLANPICGHTCF